MSSRTCDNPRAMAMAIATHTKLAADLPATAVIPYQEPAAKGDNSEFSSTVSSTLPMAAIFMRNRYIGW